MTFEEQPLLQKSTRRLGTYLKDVVCNVIETNDASSAITTIIGTSSTNDKISIAHIDYQMPGMSGYELATTLKTIPFAKEIKLILLTSPAQKGDISVVKEKGFARYLSKSVRRDELLNCIAIVLGLKSRKNKTLLSQNI